MGTFYPCQSSVQVDKLLDKLEAEGKANGFIRRQALVKKMLLDRGEDKDEDFPEMPSLVTHPLASTSAQSAGECQQYRRSGFM